VSDPRIAGCEVPRRLPRRLAGVLAVLLVGLTGCRGEPPAPPVAGHEEEVLAWRQNRHERLQDREGWLSLVGLGWLEPGVNSFGSDPGAAVPFPAKAPPEMGRLIVEEGRVTLEPAAGVELLHDGEPIAEPLAMTSDAEGEPTEVAWGSLRFSIIDRRGELAVRIRDRENPLFEEFHGLDYFPIDPAWRQVARFEAYQPPRPILVPDIFGSIDEEPSPGAVVFRHRGREVRLDALPASGGRLFLIFGDPTNGTSTYGGGRYLYTDPPADGEVVVDFNQAYSPPCIFTPYATCPLPPRQNRLPFSVEAGEKTWRKH
jgi:uncharacterized protein